MQLSRHLVLVGAVVALCSCGAERQGTAVQSTDSPLACATAMGESIDDVRGWLAIATDGSADGTVNVIDLRDKPSDNVILLTDRKDLVCGSPFNDAIDYSNQTNQNQTLIILGDLFLGGGGNDTAFATVGGVFHGGDGDDSLNYVADGTFVGGAGNDAVTEGVQNGTFIGDDGDDTVKVLWAKSFDGGAGTDTVSAFVMGDLTDVESCTADPKSPFGCPTAP